MYAPDGIVITASLLTIASYNYSYIRLAHLRIRYAPREYYKWYAKTLWAAWMRYAICEYNVRYAIYAIRRMNAICDTRIHYGPRECDMRYANMLWAAQCDMRYVNRLRAMSNCKVAFSATPYISTGVSVKPGLCTRLDRSKQLHTDSKHHQGFNRLFPALSLVAS